MNQLNDFIFWSSLKSKESTLLKEVRDNINSNINVQAGTTIDRKGFGPHKMNRYTISRLIMCAIRTYVRAETSNKIIYGYAFNSSSIVEAVTDTIKRSYCNLFHHIIPSYVSKSMFSYIMKEEKRKDNGYAFGVYVASLYDNRIAITIFDSDGNESMIDLEPCYRNSSECDILTRKSTLTGYHNIYLNYGSRINFSYASDTAVGVRNLFDSTKKIKFGSVKEDIKVGILASSGTIGAIFTRMLFMSGFRNIIIHPSAITYTNTYEPQIDPSITPDKKTLEFFGNDIDVIFIINEDGTRLSMLVPCYRGNKKILIHFNGQNMAYMVSMLYLTMTDITDRTTIVKSRTTTDCIKHLCDRYDSNITCIDKGRESSRLRLFDKSIYISDTEEFNIFSASDVPDAISTALFILCTIGFFKDKKTLIGEMYDRHMAKNIFSVSFVKIVECPDGFSNYDFTSFIDKPIIFHNKREMVGAKYYIKDFATDDVSKYVSRDTSIVLDFDRKNKRIRICANILVFPDSSKYFSLERYANMRISNTTRSVKFKDLSTLTKAIEMVQNTVLQIADML